MLSLALFMDRVQTYTAILTGFASQGSDPHRSEEKVALKKGAQRCNMKNKMREKLREAHMWCNVQCAHVVHQGCIKVRI